MDIDDEFYYEQDNSNGFILNREEPQDLEEAHFYQTISAFEELLVTNDPDLIVWNLSKDSVDKLKEAIDNLVPF